MLILGTLVRRCDLIADPDDELRIAERLTLMPRDFRIGLRLRLPFGVSPQRVERWVTGICPEDEHSRQAIAMDIIGGATRVVTRTADATTAAAGAVSGAAINGIVGGVQGTATGIRNGLSAGSHSTPAALLTLGAVGATGLVEWPLLLAVGGTALLVHQFSRHDNGEARTARSASSSPTKSASTSSTSSSRRRATSRTPAKKTAKKAAPRKTAARSRSRASR